MFYKIFTYKFKNGYSLAEMMVVISILSILAAASVPIITKRRNDTSLSGIPVGSIIAWSGALNTWPNTASMRFVLCDGTNGTPDLRSRFIIGAGGSYSVGSGYGNYNPFSTPLSLTINNWPSHAHSLTSVSNDSQHSHIYSFDSQGAHSHAATFSTSNGGGTSHVHYITTWFLRVMSGHYFSVSTANNSSYTPPQFQAQSLSLTSNTDGAHTHSGVGLSNAAYHNHTFSTYTAGSTGHTHSISTGNPASSTASVPLNGFAPPYRALYYIQRIN